MGNHLFGKLFRRNISRLFCGVGLMVLMLVIMACSEKNADAPPYNKVHSEPWNNTQYFTNSLFHGTEVKARGYVSCTKCHDINGEGQEPVPGCSTCHFGPEGSRVPEGSGWAHGLDGHEAFENEQDVCNSCHEVGRSNGTGPGICHNCHGSGEGHVLGQPWLDRDSSEFHGDLLQDDCAICHNLSTDCYECHFGPTGSKTPDNSRWLHGRIEDHEDWERYAGICNQCHSLTRSYRGEPESCHDCHDDDD